MKNQITTPRDIELFDKVVLLVSSTSRTAVEEIDNLLSIGGGSHQERNRLRRARRGVEGLARISEYLE